MSYFLSLNSPLTQREVENIRLVMRKQVPKFGIGAHLHRRMGQSLEFREYRDYVIGEDIRKVDWAASLRRGQKSELVVRTFEAEESRNVLIILDCRPTMMLPVNVEKIIVAGWLAQCLSLAALSERDKVIVGTIYGDTPPFSVNSKSQIVKIEKFVATMLEKKSQKGYWEHVPRINISKLTNLLKPASVVILISDMLMRHEQNELSRFGKISQQNYRTLHIVEIDTWPMERYILQQNPFVLEEIEGSTFENTIYESQDDFLQQTTKNLQSQRKNLRKLLNGRSLVWPDSSFAYEQEIAEKSEAIIPWFRTKFRNAKILPSLLSRKGL